MLGILDVFGLFLTLFERDFVFVVGISSNIFLISFSCAFMFTTYVLWDWNSSNVLNCFRVFLNILLMVKVLSSVTLEEFERVGKNTNVKI